MADAPKPTLKLDATKTHVYNLINIGSPLISCRYEPKGRFVFAGAQDFHMWRWDHAAGKKMQLKGADAWVRAIVFSMDGKTMLTGGYDGRLLWWPIDGDTPTRAIDAHHGWVKSVAVSPDGALIATSGNDRLIKLWSFNNGKLVRTLKGHESRVYNIAFHPDGQHLASSDLKCNIFDWEIATGKLARKLKAEKMHTYDKNFKADIGGARSIQFNTDGTKLAIGGITNVTNAFACIGNPAVVVIDWKTGKNVMQHLAKATFKGVAWGIALHPNGMVVAGAGGPGGGQLYFWEKDGKNEFHKFKMKDTCRDLHLSPDPTRLVTAHYDGHLRISKMAAKSK